jgi:hypothetical protein
MRLILRAVTWLTILSLPVIVEAAGITYDRAKDVLVDTNNMSAAFSNRLVQAGVTNPITLQGLLECFWMGPTSYFQNVRSSESVTVDKDLTVSKSVVVSNIPLNDCVFGYRLYTYENTGTVVSTVYATAGDTFFTVGTQDVGRLHIGMSVTGAMFSAGTTITNVDYGTRKAYTSVGCASNASAATCSFWGSGTYTHVVPSSWLRCRIIVTGGGGSGGKTSASGAGAGGAGGTSIGNWPLTPGDSYVVTVGAGGASVTSNTIGNAGGTSSFGSLQTATGGGGGLTAGSDYAGGAGGVGSGGQINSAGGNGGSATSTGTEPGIGGSSYWGGGAKSLERARSPGGGGGCGGAGSAGGAGRHGIVVVEYF